MAEVPQVKPFTAVTSRVTGVVYRRKWQRTAPSVNSSDHTMRALHADPQRLCNSNKENPASVTAWSCGQSIKQSDSRASKRQKIKPHCQPLQLHHATATNKILEPRHPSQPDLSCEANYFADLDSEVLLEDTTGPNLQQCVEQPHVAGTSHLPGDTHSNVEPAPAHHLHAAMQTPDAAWLANHHPALQAKYVEYVNCMGTKLTPMPIEDFCRHVGKDGWGAPVFNT